jgi:hypothetical protein
MKNALRIACKKYTLIMVLIIFNIHFFNLFAQINPTEKIELINQFQNNSLPVYFMDCGAGEQDILGSYFNQASGFSVHFYSQKRNLVNKNCTFILSIVKKPFFEFVKKYGAEYKEVLGEHYNEITARLNKGEKFYIIQKGSINKLILCGQNKQDIARLLVNLLSPTFPADSIDSDHDGLPDYFERQIGTDPYNSDTDGDGLSDYDEIFKYKTDPLKKDSDGDGISDSDWNKRREHTYTIRTVREIYPPYDTLTMNDFFQDTRVIKQKKDTLIFESILYPDAVNFIIPLTKNPITYQKSISQYTIPSFFCNYTPEMHNELMQLISTWEISNNYELLQSFARYMMIITSSYPSNEALTFYIEVVNGKVKIVYPDKFNEIKTEHFISDESVLNHLTFGEAMYRNRMRGTCSSSAIFVNTLLRAIDFPTRIVTSNPIVNYTDSSQVKLIYNLRNEKYRNIALSQKNRLTGYANHFFYEVYINGRWIRCDYDKVNINCVNVEGLFTIQDKFLDFSDRDFAHTWGKRMVDDVGNAYKTLELSDQFPTISSNK